MTFAIHVEGGTNAGRRQVRETPKAWLHVCKALALEGGRELPGYLARCPDCGSRRDGRVSFAEASVANEALNA